MEYIIEALIYWIIAATLAGGALSVSISGALSFTVLTSGPSLMVSYAVGVLLAAAFLHLLPEAFSLVDNVNVLFAVTFAGVLLFFLLEKTTLWRHRHDTTENEHSRNGRVATMIIVGDGFHNFVDGILIAAAFLTDVKLGIAATLAIIAHEIPQEVGDFMVLLHAGYGRKKALMLNLASSLMSVVGGIFGYFALDNAREATPYVLVIAAASFIYIAVADLIPDMHQHNDTRSSIIQISLITAGIGTIVLTHALLDQ